MWCTLFVEVRALTPKDLQRIVEDCVRTGAVAGAFSGLAATIAIGPGAGFKAAAATFAEVLGTCLVSEGVKATISFPTACGWGSWEC